MCTLAVFVRCWHGSPLVVAANRDERLDRTASGPQRWADEAFVAPRDLAAGGTWLGLHASGMFVGVTNRMGAARDPALASRGALVVEALRLGRAAEVHAAFRTTLDARRYNPFHLFYADAVSGGFITWFDGRDVHQEAVPSGLVVVTEQSLGANDHGRAQRVRARLEPFLAGARAHANEAPPLESLAPAMREHDDANPLAAACVHVPSLGYGTRSSLLLDVRAEPEQSRWLWADGPPCATEYVPVDLPLWPRSLSRRPSE